MSPTPEASGEPRCKHHDVRQRGTYEWCKGCGKTWHPTRAAVEAASLPAAQGGDVVAHPAVDLLRDWLIQFIARNAEAEAEGFPCREPCYFVPEQARKLLMELGAALDARPSPPQEDYIKGRDDADALHRLDRIAYEARAFSAGFFALEHYDGERVVGWGFEQHTAQKRDVAAAFAAYLARVPPPQGAPEASVDLMPLARATHCTLGSRCIDKGCLGCAIILAALQRAREGRA